MMKNKGIFRACLAFYVVTLSFAFLFLITFYPEAQEAKSNDIILGFLLGTGLSAIVSFYFGSSEEDLKPLAGKEKEDERN